LASNCVFEAGRREATALNSHWLITSLLHSRRGVDIMISTFMKEHSYNIGAEIQQAPRATFAAQPEGTKARSRDAAILPQRRDVAKPEPTVSDAIFATGIGRRLLDALSDAGHVDGRRNDADCTFSVRADDTQKGCLELAVSYRTDSLISPSGDVRVTRSFPLESDEQSWLRGEHSITNSDYRVLEQLSQGVSPAEVLAASPDPAKVAARSSKPRR
jgi:hypothetical protein